MPSKQRAAWLVVADPERLDAAEQRFVHALIARSPELDGLISLAREFRSMVRCKQADRLDGWLAAAKGAALAGFAGGLVRDLAAVQAALSLPWSTGPVEGQISRLKTIKRTMCGRAGFKLLRHRVLQAARTVQPGKATHGCSSSMLVADTHTDHVLPSREKRRIASALVVELRC